MNFVLVFILPSIFGFKLIYDNIDYKKNKLNLFIYSCILVLLTNFICSILVLLKNSADCNIVLNASNSLKFSLIYIAISIFVGYIIGFIITFVDKYFNINVEVVREKNTKNSK